MGYYIERADTIQVVLDDLNLPALQAGGMESDPTVVAIRHIANNRKRLGDRVVFWRVGEQVDVDWKQVKADEEALITKEKNNTLEVQSEQTASPRSAQQSAQEAAEAPSPSAGELGAGDSDS